MADIVEPTKVSNGRKLGTSERWSQIICSKDYGVCTYPPFKEVHEQMKTNQPRLNYFKAASEIRNHFEHKPEWKDYLSWVRSKYPDQTAIATDPIPRKSPPPMPVPTTMDTVMATLAVNS